MARVAGEIGDERSAKRHLLLPTYSHRRTSSRATWKSSVSCTRATRCSRSTRPHAALDPAEAVRIHAQPLAVQLERNCPLALELTPTFTLCLMPELTVSELARRVGTTPDTVRYYERIGLLPEVARSPSGYRLFGDEDVERLRFIKRAQRLGLQLEQIRELVAVRERGLCACGHVRDQLVAKLKDIEEEMASLATLRDDIRNTLEGGTKADAGCWSCAPQLYQLEQRPRR